MGPLSQAEEKYFHHENPYWSNLIEHTTYDEFWQVRDISQHLHHVPPAVLTVGGWFDAEDPVGPLKVFRSVEEKNPAVANHLVMGPWSHGVWAWGSGEKLGDVRFKTHRRSGLSDRCLDRRRRSRRRGVSRPLGSHLRHRLRFRRQADRCLSGRLS